MKKCKLIVLILLVFIVTGCTTYRVDKLTYEKLVDAIIYDKTPKVNTALQGFKFYLPRDSKIISSSESNAVLYSGGTKYYLYIDLISYYNKTNNDYNLTLEGERIFTKKIEYQDKEGYIIITKQEKNYFLEIMHNYGKIEVITDEDNIKLALTKSLILLSSIDYNDKVIESLIGVNSLNYKEETYNLLSPNENRTDFLDYAEEYEDVDNELPDEDVIPIEDE